MADQEFRLETIISTFENDTRLAEALFFPEVAAYGRNPGKVIRRLRKGVSDVLAKLPLLDVHRRRSAGTPQVRKVAVELQSADDRNWQTPVTLTFHVVVWTHGQTASIAYVPALGIEVVARRAEELESQIEKHIRFALMRRKATTSLRPLVWLQRCESVDVEPAEIPVAIKTPRQVAEEQARESEKSVLKEVATNLAKIKYPDVFELDDVVVRLADALAGRNPQSVLLVGPSGAGKTAAVHELVRQRAALELGQTPFWTTSGARLVAGACGFGMWEERCRDLCREAAKTKAVVHLGNLVELMQVGQSEHNDQGIGHTLRPYIERGNLLAVAECTEEQLKVLQHEAANVLGAFLQVQVDEPSPERGRKILRKVAERAGGGRLPLEEEAIDVLDRLHRRYATYSAYPGRPLRFLKNLLRDRTRQARIDAAAVTAAFSKETGLPGFLLRHDVRLDLTHTQQWFRDRVLGQQQAVSVIVNTLASIKAQLTRPNRPIASLLFIGPTGVGKTEMAKALAEFLYQDRQRITRIDMSEYAEYTAVERLIGGLGSSEGLLTSKVREQPFGVVLLDEFEKAHPRLFDMLLQVLGEGRLTDAAGRLADFRNAVIIMTSNLGAESFGRSLAGFGSPAESPEQTRDHFSREVQRFMRPELFNRIDRIVPFLALDRTTLHGIARRELELLTERDGIRYRDLRLEYADEVAEWVVRHGYEPRYGARPLKRAIERGLLAPLSAAVNQYDSKTPLTAEVALAEDGPAIRVRARARRDDEPVSIASLGDDHPLRKLAGDAARLRRQAMRVDRSQAVVAIRNELFRLEQLQRREQRRGKAGQVDAERAARKAELDRLVSRVEELNSAAQSLEDQVLMACYVGDRVDRDDVQIELAALGEQSRDLILDLYARDFPNADRLTLAVYGTDTAPVFELAESYRALALRCPAVVDVYELTVGVERKRPGPETKHFYLAEKLPDEQSNASPETILLAVRVDQPASYLTLPHDGVIGILLRLRGRLVYPRLAPEAGLHVFTRSSNRPQRCLVDTSDARPVDYHPPSRIDRRDAIGSQPTRRVYDRVKQRLDDKRASKKQFWTGEKIVGAIDGLIQAHLLDQAREWIER